MRKQRGYFFGSALCFSKYFYGVKRQETGIKKTENGKQKTENGKQKTENSEQ